LRHGEGLSRYKQDVINYIMTEVDPHMALKNWKIE
jgi:hypothetical protein